MPLIELKDVCKTYDMGKGVPVPALKSTTLNIEAGEFVAIMGPSGSGKSTLLAVLGLLDKADRGSYKLQGTEVTRLNDREYAVLRSRFLGFIFQSFNLLPRFDVLGNAMLPFLYAPATKENRDRLRQILEKIGLNDRLKHRPNELSGGQQQRVAIARALANNPLIIFADEPTGNLDSRSALEIITLLKELNSQGTTIVMVTHEPDLAQVADRILTLKDGTVVSDQKKHTSKAAVVRQPANSKKRRHGISPAEILNYTYESFLSLLANKLRSFLSILGVLIGVAAVITMLAIGTGAQKQVQDSLSSMGTNILMVTTNYRTRGISLGSDSVTRFTFDDQKGLQKIEGVKYVVPYVNGRAQVVYKDHNWNTSISGTSKDYQYVRNSIPNNGHFITEAETSARAKVAVLGKTVADQLFEGVNPVGQMIRINRISFSVIGVLPEKGTSGFRNLDDQVIIPVTTAMYRLLGRDYISNFDVQTADSDSVDSVQQQITPVIARLHRFNDQQSESVDVRNMVDLQKATSDVVNTFAFLLGSIAAVSLLVGGIGIMNIMLVLVMERTHEIGLRKALGAENNDILLQFLIESVLICTLGGLLGILLGYLVSTSIFVFVGWYTIVSVGAIMTAFSFSILIGLVFGIWPAMRAAQMMPIEALRWE